MSEEIRLITCGELANDAIFLSDFLTKNDVGGIVGIPRSGMIPASILSTTLHLPLGSYDKENGTVVWLSNGWRSSNPRNLTYNPQKRLAIVDDTIYNGFAIENVVRSLSNKDGYNLDKLVFCSVYARAEGYNRLVSMGITVGYAKVLESPHILEWNLMNSAWVTGNLDMESGKYCGGGLVTDLDGVLLHDILTSGGKEEYVLSPYLVPKRMPVNIVSGRLESERKVTEEQLNRAGVLWDNLMLMPDWWGSKDDYKAISAWKATCMWSAFPSHGLFVESDGKQARIVHNLLREKFGMQKYVLSIQDKKLITDKDCESEDIRKDTDEAWETILRQHRSIKRFTDRKVSFIERTGVVFRIGG